VLREAALQLDAGAHVALRGASGAGKTTLLGLDTPLGSRGHGLSGGQAQRVALARLFLRDPGLILLDEPAAHLDAATQARVLDEVLAFAQGRTLLLATHADAVARRLPRQWMLEQGRLRELQPA
ncbi:ATP-binding cassette domain-containing protein, partial [Bordetella pertussis]|uniref:ATP-binding cassette domain-containing protein n=1 Tax=Bordetella pertussis TaxID=520 RepID=UPI000A588DA2